MLGLKLNHVSKRGYWCVYTIIFVKRNSNSYLCVCFFWVDRNESLFCWISRFFYLKQVILLTGSLSLYEVYLNMHRELRTPTQSCLCFFANDDHQYTITCIPEFISYSVYNGDRVITLLYSPYFCLSLYPSAFNLLVTGAMLCSNFKV